MNTTTRLSVALAGALFSTLTLAAPPLELKGLALGKPVDCERLETIGGQCSWSGWTMTWDTTLAGLPATLHVERATDETVASIRSSEFNFDATRRALVGKWGPGQCEETPVMNGFGAHFSRTVCRWQDGHATLWLARNVERFGDQELSLTRPDKHEAAKRGGKSAAGDI